jgi:hypothetical protein
MLAYIFAATALVAVPTSPVAYPHPLITEVLFNVPAGQVGDANRDGVRSANGDEFIELVNPHDRAIELEGYTITDGLKPEHVTSRKSKADPKSTKDLKPAKEPVRKPQISFTFPKLTLKPGERVVVFNGYKQKFDGPHGTQKVSPSRGDSQFSGAYVFTMETDSSMIAFNNDSDAVQLLAPAPKGSKRSTVDVIHWGGLESEAYDTAAALIEEIKTGKGSMHRIGRSKEWAASSKLDGTLKGLFSPGVVDLDAVPAAAPAPAATPVPAPAATPAPTSAPTSAPAPAPAAPSNPAADPNPAAPKK